MRAAVWDLGSSSFHLLVCDAEADGSLVPVMRRRALLNLGTSIGAYGFIPPERARAATSACRRLKAQLDMARPEITVAFATAALRDASNGSALVRRIQDVIGTPVQVLDGPQEARLCFVGQRSCVWVPRDREVLGIDLGGGSLEVAVGDRKEITFATSVPIGPTRLSGELGADSTGSLSTADVDVVTARVSDVLDPVAQSLDKRLPALSSRTLLSGGTARAMARLAAYRVVGRRKSSRREPGDSNQVELRSEQVGELAESLGALSLEQRLALPGMPARRAPVMALGALVVCATAAKLGIEYFVVSEWGLREGAILEALSRA